MTPEELTIITYPFKSKETLTIIKVCVWRVRKNKRERERERMEHLMRGRISHRSFYFILV